MGGGGGRKGEGKAVTCIIYQKEFHVEKWFGLKLEETLYLTKIKLQIEILHGNCSPKE